MRLMMAETEGELIPTRWSLIGRLKNWDDRESWMEFFETYRRLIYGTARKAGLSNEASEEVVQDTLIAVCRNIGDFRTDPTFGSFKAWLLTQTRWRILDQVRKRNGAGRGGSDRITETRTDAQEKVPDPFGNRVEMIWAEEWERTLLDAALEKLKCQASPRQFQIFYLHVVKQRTPREVAQGLGVSVGQVYLAKHRLFGVFKKAVKETEEVMARRENGKLRGANPKDEILKATQGQVRVRW